MPPPQPRKSTDAPPEWVNGAGTVASPYAPGGGSGPGVSRQPGPLRGTTADSRFPHPQAPGGRYVVASNGKSAGPDVSRSDTDVQNDIADRAEKLVNGKSRSVVAGNGKHEATCWDLPEKLLHDSGGATSNDLTKGDDFAAGKYVWGDPVKLSDVQRGDIVQFTDSMYTIHTDIEAKYTDGGGWSGFEEQDHRRAPIHSAVVVGVTSDSEWTIIEQHLKGTPLVVRNTLYLKEKKNISTTTTTEPFVEPGTHKRHPNARVTRTISVINVSDPEQTIKAYRPKAK